MQYIHIIYKITILISCRIGLKKPQGAVCRAKQQEDNDNKRGCPGRNCVKKPHQGGKHEDCEHPVLDRIYVRQTIYRRGSKLEIQWYGNCCQQF